MISDIVTKYNVICLFVFRATNPSQFEIEFFVNDLSKPGASTFESLGGLEYKQNVHIQLECDRKHLPTDGLVLRGWYTTITLAVYGTLTKSLSNPQEILGSAAAPAASVPIAKEEPPVNNVLPPEQDQEWYYENQTHANALVSAIPASSCWILLSSEARDNIIVPRYLVYAIRGCMWPIEKECVKGGMAIDI